jgi:hypothetical protein
VSRQYQITEPSRPLDGMSPGDVVLGVRPVTRGILEQHARQASGVPPQGAREVAPEPAAPEGPALPSVHVAQQHAGREIGRLRAQVEAGRRDLGRYVWTASGSQVSDPGVLAMRAELAAQVEAADAEASRLENMDDLAVRQWAYDHGVR